MIFPRILKATAATVLFVSLGLQLSGCAAKPDLPMSEYDSVANAFAEVYACGVSGNISPDDALWAKRLIYWNLSKYEYSENYLSARFSGVAMSNSPTPTTERCNHIAINASEYKQVTQENNAIAQANQQSTLRALDSLADSMKPVSTTCTRLGIQTFCNSY